MSCALDVCWSFLEYLGAESSGYTEGTVLYPPVILHLLYFVGLPGFSQHDSSNFPFHPKLHTSQPWQEGSCLEPVLEIAEMFDINSVFRIHYSASNDKSERV